MARRLALKRNVGETLLTSKLQILNGTGSRRPSIALSILTGRVAEHLSIIENFYADDPVVHPIAEWVAPLHEEPILQDVASTARPHYVPRTVYLAEEHLRDIELIVDVLSRTNNEPRRLTRSAVLRHAVEHLRTAVEADPAQYLLENE